jgi:cytochrome c-type biogenesis protein CcmH
MHNDIDTIKRQLLQLQASHAAGNLSAAQYEESRAPLERRLADLILQDASVTAKPSKSLWFALGGLVLAIAAAGYWWMSTPAQRASGTDAARFNPHAGNSQAESHASDGDQMGAMADRLAARLREQPDNADGWAMLARTYGVLGRQKEALMAYENALALRKDNPDVDVLADYADALAQQNNFSLAGEPIKLVNRALKIDPRHVKALSLAGTYAFERKDYAGAVKQWQQMVDIGPADHPLVQQVGPSLARAREMAGQSPVSKKPVTPTATPIAASASVSGTVTLSTTLSQQASPEDTVFIYARAAEGSRMPLAIVRKQVKDLPVRFTLDDSMAMSPAGRLSGADKIIVGARVSKTGDARPQPGDLSGQIGPVKLGASNLNLEIREQVKP